MNIPAQRMLQLARVNMPVLHVHELGARWRVCKANTLRVTLARYCRQGLLHRVYRGLYALAPPRDLDPWLVAIRAVHAFSYVSTETILAAAGIINQQPECLTLVSSVSRSFSINTLRIKARKMKTVQLHNLAGLVLRGAVYSATPERAVADLLHFNPRAHLDTPSLCNWRRVRALQNTLGFATSARKQPC